MFWNDPLFPALLFSRHTLVELGLLLCCFALAWGTANWVRKAMNVSDTRSIWLGERVLDGVLFPLLLWLGVLVSKVMLTLAAYPVVILKWMLPILVSLLVIRTGVKVLQVAFGATPWTRALERTISWVVWLCAVLWETGVGPNVLNEMEQISWHVGASTLSLRNLLEGGLTAAAVLMVSLWISAAIEDRLLQSATGDQLSLRKAASNVARALLMSVGMLVALSAIGIDLRAFSVIGGAIGVGVGFGLQKLAANYVSGFVILAERSMRIGDLVRIDQFEGYITQINARYSVIRTLTGRESIVPNEMLMTSRIENLSLADPKVWQSTQVAVAYDSDVDVVQALLLEAVLSQDRVLREPQPAVSLAHFGADGLEFVIGYWMADPENGQLNLKSQINIAILHALRRQGIEIPFPQRVLHTGANSVAPVPIVANRLSNRRS